MLGFVDSTLRNKLQWNFNLNSIIFIEENAFENVLWKMAAVFFRLNVKTAIREDTSDSKVHGANMGPIWVLSAPIRNFAIRDFLLKPCNLKITSLRPGQNGRHFPNIFKCIFLNENFLTLNKISIKYIPYGLINNMAALFQKMAWCRTGDKPLSEGMWVCCTDTYMCNLASMS